MKRVVLFFMIFSVLAFSDSVTDMKKKVKNIEHQINQKNTRIKTIDVEKQKIQKQIKDIEEDIVRIEKDREKTVEEIKTVSKNIEYGEKNLDVSSDVMKRKKLEYKAKLIAWNRYSCDKDDFSNQPLMRKNFKNLLLGDLKKMEYIQSVQVDIKTVKKDIEREKIKLSNLRNKLAQNLRNIDRMKKEKNILIAKLNNEKSTHVKTISKLRKEKERIEKQIKQIIVARTKTDTKVVNKSQAYSKLGKTLKPVEGKIVVAFGQEKEKGVSSNGIEIMAQMGRKVVASSGGKVIYADNFQGLGKVVMIDYGYNMIGVYGNLISTNVKLNQRVEKGGEIGILGLSTDGKPNLYYEVRFNLKPINPVPMF